MSLQAMHRQRKMVLIAAASGLIATFLPWFTVSVFGYSQSVNGWHGVGFLSVVGFTLAGIVSLTGMQSTHLSTGAWFLALTGSTLALLGIILFWSDLPSDVPAGMAGASVGLYLSLVAAIAMGAFTWIYRAPGTTLREGFDAVKRNMQDRINADKSTPS